MDSLLLQAEAELARRSITASIGQVALFAIFAHASDFRKTSPALLAAAGALIVGMNALRFYLGVHHKAFLPEARALWNRLFALSILLPAAAWGFLFFQAIQRAGISSYTTLIAVLIGSGISAAITASTSPRQWLARSFLVLVIGQPLIALLLRVDDRSISMALIFVAYFIFLWIQLKAQSHVYWEGLRNQELLAAQSTRLQGVLDAIPGLVLWISPELRIHGVNRNYALNYHVDRSELVGRNLSYRNKDEDLLQAVGKFVASPLEQAAREVQLTIGGARRWHLLVMRKTKAPIEIFLVCMDVHDLKELKAELEDQRLKSELTGKLAALGEVSSSIAHDIRNPLTALMTSTELTQNLLSRAPYDIDHARRILERMQGIAMTIEKITDGLTRFSRKTEDEPFAVTSLEGILNDSITLVEPYLRANRVSLYKVPLQEEILLRCRPVEISQILVNLITNAIDAASGSPERWMRLSVISYANEREVEIRVADSGKGIAPEAQLRIFQPFFTTKPSGKGTGLGLSISRRIAERHGGKLEFDSNAPNTTFVLRLPAHRIRHLAVA